MTKVVFLDVDGVLNSEAFFVSQERSGVADRIDRHIDPIAVGRLQRIVDGTGAVVVVTSVWRFGTLYDVLLDGLARKGFTGRVLGKTGSCKCRDCLRGNEILGWIKDNEAVVGDYYEFKSYVIIDDDSDMLYWQRDNFVQTDGHVGLTDADADKAIEILGGK